MTDLIANALLSKVHKRMPTTSAARAKPASVDDKDTDQIIETRAILVRSMPAMEKENDDATN